MLQETDWPDRLYIEGSNKEKFQELVSKGDNDSIPFKVAKEVFMFALVMGYLSGGKPKPIKDKKELIHERYLDPKLDKPIIKAVFMLSQEGNDENILDRAAAVRLAEEYASLGFDDLYDTVMKGEDMVISLTKYLIENHISDNKEEEIS